MQELIHYNPGSAPDENDTARKQVIVMDDAMLLKK
jgi:hypothetical protein